MSSNPTSATPAGTPAEAFPAASAPSDSVPPVSALAELLRHEAPHLFTEGRVDLERLKTALGESAQQGAERYGLSWAGRGDCFRQIQQAWTGKTLLPCREESVNFDTTQNLFIEGENLQVLKLLQRVYHGKVKMIYIDPPYNTGSDSFVYPDRFKEGKEAYERRAGMRDAEGNWTGDVLFRKNTRENGHYHSNWLTMMYPRLFLARQLLRDDGVMFVSIDDNEVHTLRMIMDEIFGEENRLCALIWNKQHSQQQGVFKQYHEYVLVYSKDATDIKNIAGGEGEIEAGALKKISKANPASEFTFPPGVRFDAPDGTTYSGSFGDSERVTVTNGRLIAKDGKTTEEVTLSAGWTQKDQMAAYFSGNQVKDTKGQDVLEFFFSSTGKLKCRKQRTCITPPTILPEYGMVSEQTGKLTAMLGASVFDMPKPVSMVSDFIKWFSGHDGMVLDFFSGSGTTAQSVLNLNQQDGGNRRFICVQLPEPTPDGSAARQAGYGTIADIGKERIRRVINKMAEEAKGKLPDMARESPEDLGFKVFKLAESGLREWECPNVSAEELARQLELFTDTVKPESVDEGLLYELILGGEGELTAPVERMAVGNGCWYSVDGGRLAICVERKITQELVEAILAAKPQKVICLDIAFAGNDPLKKNMALQLEAAKIEFKTV